METASVVVEGTNLQPGIGSLKLLANIILDGMRKPDVDSEVLEVVITTNIVNDHQLVVPDEALIRD